jgi:hypothetical protein
LHDLVPKCSELRRVKKTDSSGAPFVATPLDPATIRWVDFGHFESDECGVLLGVAALAPVS